MNEDRRRSDFLVKAILFLLGLLQTIITGWCYAISNRSENNSSRLYTLEEKVTNLKEKMDEIGTDVKTLVRRK